MALLSLAGLSGCGGNVPTDPVTMSEAFDTESVWYVTDTQPDMDEEFEGILVFHGGYGTIYATCFAKRDRLTFSDIENLSDEEIINIVRGCASVNYTGLGMRTDSLITELDFEERDNPEENIKVGNMYLNGYTYSVGSFNYYPEKTMLDSGSAIYTRVPENHPGFVLDSP